MTQIRRLQKALLVGLWSSLCFQYVACQINPAFGSLVRKQKQAAKAGLSISDYKGLLSERGIDVDNVESLLHDDHRLAQFVRTHLAEAVEGARHVQVEAKLWYGLDDESLLSEICYRDTMQYFSDLDKGEVYAKRMRGAHGNVIPKLETAEYTLNFKDFGNHWLCTSNTANKTSGVPSFDAQYCAAVGSWFVVWGTCSPNTCTTKEIQAVSDTIWSALGVTESPVYYECNEPEEWRTADIAFLALMSFFLAMVVAGTFYEIYLHKIVLAKVLKQTEVKQREDDPAADDKPKMKTTSVDDPEVFEVGSEVKENGAKCNGGFEKGEDPVKDGKELHVQMTEEAIEEKKQKKPKIDLKWAVLDGVMMSFSVVTNLPKIMSAKKTKSNLAALNGLRVISMFWVILGHSFQFQLGHLDNFSEAYGNVQSFAGLAIVNATYSVDTFFVLSGFLVTYMTLKQLESKRLGSAGSWFMFYFHRWWRLTPALMANIGIFALLKPHFAQGVLTDGFHEQVRTKCAETWWAYMLYVNNLFPWPNDLGETCFGHAWYLANDMQFYIISPLILIILYKNVKAGMALIGSIMVVSLGSLAGLNWYYGINLDPWYQQPAYNDRLADYPDQDVTYAKPYTRIPTYLVGMVMGYIIFKLREKKVKLRKIYVLVGWVCALGTLFAVVYGAYGCLNRYIEQWESIIYLTFGRLAWGIGVAWIIFACLNGYGGPIGLLLDWSFWIPMTRLTYCAYLLHPTWIFSVVTFNKTPYHMDILSLSYFYVGNLVFSYVLALVMSLVLESPFMGLEKVMFGKFKTK
ncbi:nose resistant to fluoxetine protein 6 [Strongylocentrotus purpuratus]|uniref:Acyltransferase 3 domain-containing protein n=1 Tax=Strongylocentrotus purpuratus TaxID=7668 RepID=A0A7M7RGX3_STRPU|nr:nose resistant to fluoxetine protein 6 [Strongylocentrotus purpuratus]